MKTKIISLLLILLSASSLFATGEPSTYFQIYVSPNNDAVRRDVCLVVTAIYDNTEFEIIDDGADGDTDDSKTGVLKAGQSYILYIRDNGINDDARYASGGVLKWDGDYFIVKSDKLVYASQSTDSDWQHDWVPSVNKSSIGEKFIVYAPKISSSKRDINVFAYENNTLVQFHKISTAAKTITGFTEVNAEAPVQVFSTTLNVGQDLIYSSTLGRDVMVSGETYMITSNKPITVQYGALFGNERDGGGYVPTSNGSSTGELMYFAVPYQSGGEQEIRVVSWDDNNVINLDRYSNGSWVSVKNMTLNRLKAGDWVGKNNGNVSYPTVFRITCSAGKRVSVFEGNWFETGSPGTSDMCTMVASEAGDTAGTSFLTYIAPPGNEANVKDPFTGNAFGGQFSHLYLYSKDGATVTVKDAYSNGNDFNKTFTIAAGRYADCSISLQEWRNIYNGTGTNSGPEKPYLIVTSNKDISVMNSNFNDNWMNYFGSPLGHSFTQETDVADNTLIPGESTTVVSTITTSSGVESPNVTIIAQDGLKIDSAKITSPSDDEYQGVITETNSKIVAEFNDLPNLEPNSTYTVETVVSAVVGGNNSSVISNVVNSTVETVVTGSVSGETQQSTTSNTITVDVTNTSNLIFSKFEDNVFNNDTSSSWTISWVDINSDGYDDIFVTDTRVNFPNLIYINNKAGGFTKGQVLAEKNVSMSNTWADIDNDGDQDLLVLNNTRTPNRFYRNNNGTLVLDSTKPFVQEVAYYHGGAFADYDNDGNVDLFLSNYFPTKFNELYRNGTGATFTKELKDVVTLQANTSTGPTWADYDKDGFLDLFVPNGAGKNNSLFHNLGNGSFEKANNIIDSEGGQSVGSTWGDIDNDGDLDLFVASSSKLKNFLYKNLGNGNFEKITNTDINKEVAHGCSFADVDNDGDLDLYTTTDVSNKNLFLNDGNGNFAKDKKEIIGLNYGMAFGHAWSDYDNDGDLDLAVATISNQKNHIFKNNGNSNKWLEVKLSSSVSNGSAIGAKVTVYTGGSLQYREVNSQSGIGGQSSLRQHFGLKNRTVVDSIDVDWPSGIKQRVKNVAPNQIVTITEPQQIKVTGVVFFDTNDDGVRQANETFVPRAALSISPLNIKTYSADADGRFSFYATGTSASINVLAENGLLASQESVNVNLTTYNVNDLVYVPVYASCNNVDLKVNLGGTAIRKGYTTNLFRLVVSNQGRTTASNYTAELILPSLLSIASPSIAPTQQISYVENNTNFTKYIWSLSNLKSFESHVVSMFVNTANSVQIGNEFNIKSQLMMSGSDCSPSDNTMEQRYMIYGAIDPNDILVSPKGYGDEGYILADQVLNYTIRFENIGNFPAQKVEIVDNLPSTLDVNTFKLVSSSFKDVKVAIEGNKLHFVFDDIYLPTTAMNAEASQGYVTFSIQPKVGLPFDTKIVNNASIQFDSYLPLITNSVLNTIQSKDKELQLIDVSMYPNPAHDVVYISLKHKNGNDYTKKLVSKASIITLQGNVVLEKLFNGEEEIRIDLPIQYQGVYIMKITDSEGKDYFEKLTISAR